MSLLETNVLHEDAIFLVLNSFEQFTLKTLFVVNISRESLCLSAVQNPD